MITVASHGLLNTFELISRGEARDIPGAEDIIKDCLHRSVEVRQGFVDGKLACVWGLIPPTFLSNQAYLWLATTELVAEHKFLFVRHSQRYIEEALKLYPIISGDVLIGNDSAKRWLKWLGAEFAHPVAGRIPFTIVKKNG